jgi:carboxypeptidase C (cathepsin A)
MTGELLSAGIYLNGVVLVSASGWGVGFDRAVNAALKLPYYNKIAWYNRLLDKELQEKAYSAVLKDVEAFTYDTLVPAMIRIGFLDPRKRKEIVASISRYTSLPESLILQKELDIDTTTFFKVIFRNRPRLAFPYDAGQFSYSGMRQAMSFSGMAATAWYFHLLSKEFQEQPIDTFMRGVEDFVVDEYAPGLCRRSSLDALKKAALAEKIAGYTGLPAKAIEAHDLLYYCGEGNFFDTVKAKIGFMVGAFDSRYKGIYYPGQSAASFDQAFTPAINHYLRNELRYKTDLSYYKSASVGWWGIAPSDYNEFDDLRGALSANPFMHVLFQSGYYDMVCGYFFQRYQHWQLDPGGQLRERIHSKSYASGHMIYVCKTERAKACRDLRAFIENSLPAPGHAAKYE